MSLPHFTPPTETRRKYPFRNMKIGDSFTVPAAPKGHTPIAVTAAYMYACRKGVKFSTRKEGAVVHITRIK